MKFMKMFSLSQKQFAMVCGSVASIGTFHFISKNEFTNNLRSDRNFAIGLISRLVKLNFYLWQIIFSFAGDDVY